MPVLRSFHELAQFQPVNLPEIQRQVQAREEAHAQRRLERHPATAAEPGKPLTYERSRQPGYAGREFDPRTGTYLGYPVTYPEPKRPRRGYVPVSDPDSFEEWEIYDRKTGDRLWVIRGSYRHVVREATRAAQSLGFTRHDFKVR
jgi:hypothetical protein